MRARPRCPITARVNRSLCEEVPHLAVALLTPQAPGFTLGPRAVARNGVRRGAPAMISVASGAEAVLEHVKDVVAGTDAPTRDPATALRSRRRFRTMVSSNYDINNTCNLTCEGCYYFVSDQKTSNRRPTSAEYDRFFGQEASRGVNYPVFSGGEPSLNPIALRAAAAHWRDGIVYTNGVKPIAPEVPFRIAISVWGARRRNEALRGAAAYERAFETARGDPRALIYMTINRTNVDDIPAVVADCVEHGVKIAFNDFGMTTEYMRLIDQDDRSSSPYVRFSTSEDNLSLRHEDRLRAADLLDDLIDSYPDTVLYSKLVNDWVHRSPSIFRIDPETGIATDCAYMGTSWHKGFGFDLQPLKGKPCCAPEFDCRDCRIAPAAMFTLLRRLSERIRYSAKARAELRELREYMMRFHYWNWDSEPDTELSAARSGAAAPVGE